MYDPDDPLYLATLQVKPALLGDRDLDWDTQQLTVFRSVLMKPEHLASVESFQHRVLRTPTASSWRGGAR